MPESVTLTVGGRTMVIETGELAKQANGSALVRYGDQNVVLCAVTASEKPREGIDFFPLTCDFEEKMYAAGKIPGGYIKREGRPPEHAVTQLASDRSPDSPALSRRIPQRRADRRDRALDRSRTRRRRARRLRRGRRARAHRHSVRQDGCRRARRPRRERRIHLQSDAAAIRERRHGHRHRRHRRCRHDGRRRRKRDHRGRLPRRGRVRARRDQENRQSDRSTRQEGRQDKARVSACTRSTRISIGGFARTFAQGRRQGDAHRRQRQKREAAFDAAHRRRSARALWQKGRRRQSAARGAAGDRKDFNKIIKAMEEDELRTMVVDEKIRPDGRKPDEIRPIWCKVHYVPRVHGSGIFTRGQTQVFTAATLGSTSDAQRLDGIVALENKRYMHFYNFPPYSVGETRPMRGPGRREIGHGHLAERALRARLAAEGRVSVHAAPHERSARVERLLVDGVGLRVDARADGRRRADPRARRAASRWA